jgi:hypothetical protein
MAKKALPDLPDTGRRYLEHTARARLASPGIERYAPKAGAGARAARLALALVVAAALVAAMLLLRR